MQPAAREPADRAPALDVAREDPGELDGEVDVGDDHLGHHQRGGGGHEEERDHEEGEVDVRVGGQQARIGHPGEHDARVADADGVLSPLAESGSGKDCVQDLLNAD